MNELLKKQVEAALLSCKGSHSNNITSDYLGLFIRLAKTDPQELVSFIDILINNMNTHRSNVVSSLYCLIKLSDANVEAKKIVASKIPNDLIELYIEDGDTSISSNAKILKAILSGASLDEFEDKSQNSAPKGSTIYNVNNSNLNINSPYSSQHLELHKLSEYDEETKQLLLDLKEALEKKDKVKIKEILVFLTDKGFDLLIALLSGYVFKH